MIDHNQLCELEIEICSIAKFSTGIYDSASNQPEQLVFPNLQAVFAQIGGIYPRFLKNSSRERKSRRFSFFSDFSDFSPTVSSANILKSLFSLHSLHPLDFLIDL